MDLILMLIVEYFVRPVVVAPYQYLLCKARGRGLLLEDKSFDFSMIDYDDMKQMIADGEQESLNRYVADVVYQKTHSYNVLPGKDTDAANRTLVFSVADDFNVCAVALDICALDICEWKSPRDDISVGNVVRTVGGDTIEPRLVISVVGQDGGSIGYAVKGMA